MKTFKKLTGVWGCLLLVLFFVSCDNLYSCMKKCSDGYDKCMKKAGDDFFKQIKCLETSKACEQKCSDRWFGRE